MLDAAPTSGWANAQGKARGPHVFVFELQQAAAISRFEFDTASIDGEGRGAKGVRVEVSASGPSAGFTKVLEATLQDRADGQGFAAAARVEGRWVRLTILDNHGDAEWVELMSFRGLAPELRPPAGNDVSGTYETEYGLFHVRQQGAALLGCYEYDGGLLTGSVKGRVMRITWQESGGPTDNGPAVMTFSADGKSFRGFWWNGSDKSSAPSGTWDGKKVSTTVGSCPHWKGSVGGEMERALMSERRARVYGIEFDVDSATLRLDARPVLDDVARVLTGHGDWNVTIEGHTDSTASDEHNLKLSDGRARAVREYLIGKGVDGKRLTAVGLGESRPVADNDTALGRARNRRVELVLR